MSLHLILDENSESKVFKNVLLNAGHDVSCLKELTPKGLADEQVLSIAIREKRILFTQDRGFATLANQNPNHHGIILEYVTNTSKDMTNSERLIALATIEKHYPSLEKQFVILNSFRPKKLT